MGPNGYADSHTNCVYMVRRGNVLPNAYFIGLPFSRVSQNETVMPTTVPTCLSCLKNCTHCSSFHYLDEYSVRIVYGSGLTITALC